MKVLVAAGCAGGFALAYLLFVVNPSGRALEDAALTPPDGGGSLAGASLYLSGLGIVTVLVIALVRRRFRDALAVVGLLAGAIGGGQVLKLVLLSRPGPDANSFPSGHVTACAAIVLALVLAVPQRLRPAATWVGAVVTSYVAASTVELGWHRFSDTIGALALCGAIAVLVADRRPNPVAAVCAAIAPTLAVVAGYAVLTLTSNSVYVIAATGALSSAVLLAVAWPLFAKSTVTEPRASGNPLVTAGYHEMPTRNNPQANPW